MEFAVGENVVHPAHGAGEIVDIEHNELVNGFKRYYVIEFLRNRLTMRVPMRRVDDIGMRSVMSQNRFKRVLATLRALPEQLPKNFKERRRLVQEMLQSGYPTQVAKAVRDLTWRRREKHLTKSDAEQLARGRELLVSEIALAKDQGLREAEKVINEAIEEAIQARRATLKESQDD